MPIPKSSFSQTCMYVMVGILCNNEARTCMYVIFGIVCNNEAQAKDI